MKGSIAILSIFIAGLLTGMLQIFPDPQLLNNISTYALCLLMFFVGISIGCDKQIWHQLRQINIRILLIPLTAILGTGFGMLIYLLIFKYPAPRDLFAIGSGFGYYSLSSILIGKISGEEIGLIALLSNIIREIATLIFTPILVKYFGKLSPIAAGGATTSDTTLPVIIKYSGKEYVLGAIFNGIILTLLVPILISLIYKF